MAKAKKNSNPFTRDVVFIVTALICVLLFISIIGLGGSVGRFLSGLLFGLVGILAYIFPLCLLFGLIYFMIINRKARTFVPILWGVLFLLATLFMELILVATNTGINNPIEAFENGKEMHLGGGMLGGSLSFLIATAFGKVGAFFIDIFAIIIILVILTGKSPILLLRDKHDKRKSNRKKRPPKSRITKEENTHINNTNPSLREAFAENRNSSEDEFSSDDTIEISEDKSEELINPSVRQSFGSDSKPSRMDNVVRGVGFETLSDNESEVNYEFNEVALTPKVDLSETIVPSPLPIPEPTEPVDNSFLEAGTIEVNPGPESVVNVSLDPIIEEADLTPIEPEPVPVPVPELDAKQIIEPAIEPVAEQIIEPVIEPVSEQIVEPVPTPVAELIIEPIVEPVTEHVSEPEPVPEPVWEPESEPEPAIEIVPEPEPVPEPVAEHVLEPEPSESFVSISEETSEETETDTVPEYVFPPSSLLSPMSMSGSSESADSLNETADKLVNTLSNFGVEVTIADISKGPAVTRFELVPQTGVKVSKIINLADDIKLNLAAADIRIEAPIPGKSAVGIEVPNKTVEMVHFRELIESNSFIDNTSPIAFCAGKDLGGNIVISDIAKMPHVLIAGATNSGKSVCINTIIMSILYKATPDEVRFIMIDPKVVELSVYNGIPHLLIPVVSDPKKAAGALNWAVREMNERYQRFAEIGVRNMSGYNKKVTSPDFENPSGKHQKMPTIVVIVDELADLMMVSSNEVEESICRLAQLARAAGIHLVIATQRPSVNVITGLIKANMPSRIAFAVTSGVDSRTILDMNGAEKLLGKGDMLYFPQGNAKPIRVQGAFISDDEVNDVVDFIKEHNDAHVDRSSKSETIEKEISESNGSVSNNTTSLDESRDEYFEAAGRLIIEKEKGSIGMLQRNYKIGFNRAARIMDQLAEAGVVGPEEGTKPRKILVTMEEFDNILNS